MKKYRLPKEFATKWLEALRSGEYRQAFGQLYNGDGYGCLGLAAVIHGADMKIWGRYGVIEKRMFNDVPKEFFQDNGIPSDLQTELTNLNDDLNYSFPQVADWIEENVELY